MFYPYTKTIYSIALFSRCLLFFTLLWFYGS